MRHIIIQIGEFSSTTQRSRSLAQTIIQRFPNTLDRRPKERKIEPEEIEL